MTGLLAAITKSGIANADMVRAIGSLFTKSLESSFKVGFLADILAGIIFAAFYVFVVISFEIHGLLSSIGTCMLISFIHGVVVSFLLVAAVAKHHPLKQFKQAGFSVAAAHWAAHLFYGFLVGLVIGLMGT
jgi:hypothetical protein